MVGDVSGTLLADLERDMAATDLGACSDDDLAQSLRRALRARQVVDGYVNRLAGEARRREATGSGSPAQEVIRSGGVVSNREAKALDRRAGVGEVLPTVGERVDQGATRSENADILARHLQHLSDDQRRALAVHDDEIARQAVCAPPEVVRQVAWAVGSGRSPKPNPLRVSRGRSGSGQRRSSG